MMGKRGYMEVAAFPADRSSHRNALHKSTPSPTKPDRRKDPDVTVQPIFTEQKETWFMDRRKDAFYEKSSSGSNSSIKVNIGRVEVRAATPKPSPPPSPQKAVSTSRSGLSLDDYLKRRR